MPLKRRRWCRFCNIINTDQLLIANSKVEFRLTSINSKILLYNSKHRVSSYRNPLLCINTICQVFYILGIVKFKSSAFQFCRQFYTFVLLFLILWFYAIFDNTLSISFHFRAIEWQKFVANDIKLIEMFAAIFLFLISKNCF